MELFYFIVTCVMFGVIGLCVGSFLNVVVYRLPRGMNLAKPGSHCTVCGHALAWYDNIPLLSFLILGGRCRYCKSKISPRYFCVELLNCMLWLLCVALFYDRGIGYAAISALAISVLLCIAFCDAENLFIPDSLQVALILLAYVGIFFDPVTDGLEKIYGLLLGGGFFLLFYLASFVLYRREGLGFGDVKLMAGAGLLLGWKSVCVSILVGVFAAFLKIVIFRTKRKQTNFLGDNAAEYAFAPYLVVGILVALFFGNGICNWYFALLA